MTGLRVVLAEDDVLLSAYTDVEQAMELLARRRGVGYLLKLNCGRGRPASAPAFGARS
jgi:hypothetical protein